MTPLPADLFTGKPYTGPTADDLLKVQARAKAGRCEGNCAILDGHAGPVEVCRVTAKDGKDWGYFAYCQNAQEEDIGHGFKLTKENA